jgi:hypothetical protein
LIRISHPLTNTINTGSIRMTGIRSGFSPFSRFSPWRKCTNWDPHKGRRSRKPRKSSLLKRPPSVTAGRRPKKPGMRQSNFWRRGRRAPRIRSHCLFDAPDMEQGIAAYILFEKCGLSKTRGEARRLITQGGGYVNGERIEAFDQVISSKDLQEGSLLLRAGKKRYLRVTVE